MSFALLALITWLVMIVFANIPKRFTFTEIIFLYFVSSIMTVTVFTIYDVNFHWVPATRNVEKSFALDLCRFVEIPLFLIISSEFLTNSSLRVGWRWTIAATICMLLTVDDWLLVQLGILVYRQWNYVYAFINVGLERLSVALGVFHYTKHGYNIFYSFVIYLFVCYGFLGRVLPYHSEIR